MRIIPRALILSATLMMTAAPAGAQQSDPDVVIYELPRGWIKSSPPGLVREPPILSKLALASETGIGGEPRDGWYAQTGTMITGAGWIAAGPGYRRSLLDGRARFDLSSALSWKLYKVAQGSFELPHLLRGRLALAAGARYQDALQVRYFGLGNDSRQADRSAYRLHNFNALASGRLRAATWLSIDGRVGWIPRPRLSTATGPRVNVPNTLDLFSEATAPGLRTPPAFVHGDVSAVVDWRDQSGLPTSGGMYRATAAAYRDRDSGVYSFRRYEVEAAQFIPLGTRRWVLALGGWGVFSDTSDGRRVPFYLMPSLGGKNTLRGYADYRFHDNHLQTVSIESRLALWTHMDVAVFGDAGKVAARGSDLDFRKARTSYGAGVRFHNATSTLLRVDAARSVEGWRLLISLSDAFTRSTPAFGRPSVLPFVP